MKDQEKIAVIVSLLDALEQEAHQQSSVTSRLWSGSLHPHLNRWAWNPRGADSFRLSGRHALFNSRQVGKT